MNCVYNIDFYNLNHAFDVIFSIVIQYTATAPVRTALQSQKAVTAHLKSKQLLPFSFAQQIDIFHMESNIKAFS